MSASAEQNDSRKDAAPPGDGSTPARSDEHSADLAQVQLRLGHGVVVTAASLVIILVLYMILRELAVILRPLLVAVFMCYLIVPAHRWLVSHGLPRIISYLVIVSTVLLTMYSVGRLALISVGRMSEELPRTARSVQDRLNLSIAEWRERLAPLFPETEVDANTGEDELGHDDHDEPLPYLPFIRESSGATVDEPDAAVVPPRLPPPPRSNPDNERLAGPPAPPEAVTLDDLRRQLVEWGQATLGTFLGFFAAAFIVLVYTVFLLLEVAGFKRRVVGAFGDSNAERVMVAVAEINEAVARYIVVKTFISFLIGVISAGILHWFGIKYALMWGVLTFFANFVPYVGSIFAVIFPIGLSYVQYESLSVTIGLGVLLASAQQITGSFLEPRIMGERLGVSPLMILLSLAFWGYLWGVPGMILSSPLIVTIKIILGHIEYTKPLARLMSNK